MNTHIATLSETSALLTVDVASLSRKEKLYHLADVIEKLEVGKKRGQFLMRNGSFRSPYPPWVPVLGCDAPGCIAGWACYIGDGKVPKDDKNLYLRAAQLLELSREETSGLFFPISENALWYVTHTMSPYFISPRRAASTLRRFARTGKIDWGNWEP